MSKVFETTKNKKKVMEDIYRSQDIEQPLVENNFGLKWLIFILLISFAGGFLAGFVYFNYFTFSETRIFNNNVQTATSTGADRNQVLDLNFLLKEDTAQEIKFLAELRQPLVGFYKKRSGGVVLDSLYLEKDFLGSGVAITSDGWILTHQSVLKNLDGVVAMTADKKILTPTKILIDKFSGLVFAQLPVNNLTPVKFADSNNLKPAAVLLASRYLPLQNGVEAVRVALQKTSYHDQASGEDFLLLTDVIDNYFKISEELETSYNGSPLLNDQNEVAGLLFIAGKDYVNLAMPAYYLQSAVDKFLSNNQKIARGSFGAHYLDLSETVGLSAAITEGRIKGAVIMGDAKREILAITPGSAADKAGLKAGDIILQVNGEDVNELNSLTRLLQNYSAGQEITLKVFSKGKEKELKVTLGNL